MSSPPFALPPTITELFELQRILEASEHWDGKVWSLQVVDADDRSIVLRPLASAADSGAQWNLRCEIRQKLITWIRKHHPECLPRIRAEVENAAAA